ncbi:hypothetical protein [Paraliomyxa miuraensis]|uniref:hypothetical protein n=1 Tax=Paraliomyxa miuraensis TaxID=376150 RepID=UPI00225917D2|nr:hypothetical protein [Paraliomyxa miuraensis]MCX4239355.1 hypothetical protein [Paraliomyxa miuraensis]
MSPDRDPSLLERAAALKHDLGKYVAWRCANFDDDAWTGPMTDALVEALQADLLRTRETPQGDLTAWEVFEAHTADLPAPLPEPELRTVAAAVQVLREQEPALRAGDRGRLAAARPALRQAQHEIRSALRDLHRRLMREG